MASSIPSSYRLRKPFYNPKVRKYPQVIISQSFRDEGNSANIVDANLGILRERIEEVKKKENLDMYCRVLKNGWNYKSEYDNKHKRHAMYSEFIELLGLVSASLGLVFLTGSLCIFLISFLLHVSARSGVTNL